MKIMKMVTFVLVICLCVPFISVQSVGAGENAWTSIKYEAEGSQVFHGTGRLEVDGWVCQPGIDAGNRHMIYGPYVTTISGGKNQAFFRLKVDNNTVNNDNVVCIDVYDSTAGTALIYKDITRKQFNAAGVYQTFTLYFNNTAGHSLEFRVYWYGSVYTKVDFVGNEIKNYTYEAEENQLSHATGRLDGDGWLCQTGIDAGNRHMIYGPYLSNIPSGLNRAFYNMKVDNNTANNDNIATIDVRDNTTGNVLASKTITRKQFNSSGSYQTFYLDFNQIEGHSLEFRVYWHGTSYLKVDKVGVEDVPYSGANWMGSIADYKNLASISIPGTHDSGALYEPVYGTAKCQDMTIDEQLAAGVRYLDIRCRHIDDAFAIHHGSVYQNLNFNDVLNSAYSFLNNNPTETILMSVKEEYDPSNNTRSFEQTFDSYIAANPDKWCLDTNIKNLGDVRGKIVLVRRFGASSSKGIDCTNWADNTAFTINNGSANLRIQDQYVVPDNNAKWSVIQYHFNEAKSQNSSWLYINYTSGYKSIIGIPSIRTVSDSINPQLLSYFTANAKGRFGITVMDFADNEKCAIIIASNF